MMINLGSLIASLEGWMLCIDECKDECVICVMLPRWTARPDDRENVHIALYIAARSTMDYRVAAALYIYSIRKRTRPEPGALVKAWREAEITTKIPVQAGNTCWEAVLYKGILYAQSILDLDRPVLIKITPPRDKNEREKLRVLIEGKRITIKGKTYHVGGLLKKLGGEKLAPWIYLIPKRNIPQLKTKLAPFQQKTTMQTEKKEL
ncbi:MAG: hypothetical protein F7B59_02490 [Desulfurococcales archaeon]|nr:hypothetical protein [Desulfurococcales archaeon]